MGRPGSSRVLALLGCCVVLLLLGVSPWELWERDEGRYADVAREMLARRDFVTPRIDGAVFLDKPPLVYWVTAASLALWGHGTTGARFGQLLFAVGILLVTRRIGTLLFERRRANIAVLMLASSVGFFAASHLLTLDLGLAFFVSLTMLLFLKGYRAGSAGRRAYLGMFAAIAGGVLTKGPIGVLLPSLSILGFLTLRREWRRLRELPWVAGTLLFAILVTPWYVAVTIANPEFLRYFFVHENLSRFTTTVHKHPGSWYYYLAVGAAGLLPWSLLLPIGVLRSRFRPGELPALLRQEAPALLWSWIVPGLLFFSAAQSKLPLYLLPLFPAAALLLAALVDADLRRESPGPIFLWPSMLLVAAATLVTVVRPRHKEWEILERAGLGLPLTLLVVALASGALISGWLLARRGRHVAALACAAVLWMSACYAIFTVVGRVNFFNETGHFATVLRREMRGQEPVFAYRCYLRGLPFYLNETVGLVSPGSDDLQLGRAYDHDSGSFPDETSFLNLLAGDDRVFAVVRREQLRPLQSRVGRPLFILARSQSHELVSNRLGAERERELAVVLATTRFDLEGALQQAVQSRPRATIDVVEIEKLAGVPTCTLRMNVSGTMYEIEIPMTQRSALHVETDDPVGEESGGEDHLLRLAPSTDHVSDISNLIRRAVGG